MGEHVLGALLRPGKPPIIIDRGWAPDQAIEPPPSGTVSITGYIRSPEHTPWMGAKDNPSTRRFYALDPEAIASSLGLAEAAPFTLVAMGPAGDDPEPVQSLPRPPNDHLTYAVTWFGLSGALVVVFLVYARQVIAPGNRNERI